MERRQRNGNPRNGNKRNSMIEDLPSQSVQRRTSKKTSSIDRRGQIYPDDFIDTSVRPVTPDSPPATRSSGSLPETARLSSSTTSPQSDGHESNHRFPNDDRISQRRSNGTAVPNRSLKKYVRPRNRTVEEKTRDRSPSSLMTRTRNRIGSLHSAGSSTVSEQEDVDLTSIGFPYVVPSVPSPAAQPQLAVTTESLVNVSPRKSSPVRNTSFPTPRATRAGPIIDASKILQLMKTTCGRMHGILSFRASTAGAWASGYCAINVASGSLIYQTKGDVSHAKTLIPDLRGCHVRTLYDKETRGTFLDVSTHAAGLSMHLRPHVPETFDSWLAALLCWQPIRPKGIHGKMAKPQAATISERKPSERRQVSDHSLTRDAAIIKVGKMLFWENTLRSNQSTPVPSRRTSTIKQVRPLSSSWRRISCTLQENGHLNLYRDSDVSLISVIALSRLSRCAVQKLDPTVLGEEYCIGIYPQYGPAPSSSPSSAPVYLALESRVLFEVWFVLLRAFTMPELYGPESPSFTEPTLSATIGGQQTVPDDMFRVERLFSMRVVEAKLYSSPVSSPPAPARHHSVEKRDWISSNYYAEILLDGEIRAKTSVKSETSNPFWREDFDFIDLPPGLSSASVILKARNPAQRDWMLVAHGGYALEQGDMSQMNVLGDIKSSPLDSTCGRVDLQLDDIDRDAEPEKWWPILDESGNSIGEMLLKAKADDLVVLMSQEYQQLLELLLSFSNGLTQQIVQIVPSELKHFSETFLNIFQVSAQASDWLMSLVEDEIDGLHKDPHISKFRYSRRIASNDTYESGIEREMILRDLGKSASVEANLLFRGNSLLTKALDLHMRRLGKEYLEETLMEKMRDIAESDPECEVDPNKVPLQEDLQRNWRNLITLTENVWKSIYESVPRCPPELRVIFRHIRACAEDRYGDFLRTVTYSSVSGFLFLRFFCPAVLNPKLFGLLKEQPRRRAQRTLTLIAKSLQTLANLTTFGSKEPWMEPMNVFLATNRHELKTFIDSICAIPPDRSTSAIPPSYATPITILGRLPATSKEGFPSLPYLIDQARECASLVGLWLDGRRETINGYPSNGTSKNHMSEDAKRFDELCMKLRRVTRERVNRAEPAERPSGILEVKWEELVTQLDRKARMMEEASHLHRQTEPSGSDQSKISIKPSRMQIMPIRTAAVELENVVYPDPGTDYFDHEPAAQPYSAPINPKSTINDDELPSSSEIESPPGSSPTVWDPGVAHSPVRYRSAPTPTATEHEHHQELDRGDHSVESSVYSFDTSSERANAGSVPPLSRDGSGAKGMRFGDLVGGLRRKARERELNKDRGKGPEGWG